MSFGDEVFEFILARDEGQVLLQMNDSLRNSNEFRFPWFQVATVHVPQDRIDGRRSRDVGAGSADFRGPGADAQELYSKMRQDAWVISLGSPRGETSSRGLMSCGIMYWYFEDLLVMSATPS